MESIILKLCRGGYVDSSKKSEMLRVLCSEIEMPWCGVLEGCCENIKRNNGLYTQCMNAKVSEGNCKECEKMIKKNGGVSKYGRVNDRLKSGIMCYIDPSSGKKESSYIEYMRKNGLTRSDVELYGKLCGVDVPECYFEEVVVEKKRGRPKKEKGEEKEKKKRGRPRKEKEVICNEGEELIASLLTENREKNEKKENDYEKRKESADEKKENDYEKKKESADEKKKESEIDNEGGSDDEEETLVVKFEIKGVIYLKSSDNVLYDMMSHDVIGIWNEERSEIDEIPEEYEE
jgi:hypothetical protein